MQATDRDLTRRYLHGVWNAMRHLDTLLTPRLTEELGLDLTDLVLLEYVAHTDLGPSQIASVMRLPDHTVSRLLGRLELSGLLQRTVATGDARRRVLRVTPTGRQALASAHAELSAGLAPLLRDLGPQRLQALVETLTLVVAAEAEADATAATPET